VLAELAPAPQPRSDRRHALRGIVHAHELSPGIAAGVVGRLWSMEEYRGAGRRGGAEAGPRPYKSRHIV
jgi:hypothetical protein